MVLVNQTSISGIRIELSKPNSTSTKDNPINIRYIPVLNLSVFWLLLLYSFLGFRKLQSIVLPCEEYHRLLSQRISLLPTRRYHLWTRAFQQSFGSHIETFPRETRPPELQPGMLDKAFLVKGSAHFSHTKIFRFFSNCYISPSSMMSHQAIDPLTQIFGQITHDHVFRVNILNT